MKKSKLIALLNALPGDPDVKLWNGFVGDWVEIDTKLVEQELVKQTLEHWLEMIRLEGCHERKDWTYQIPSDEVASLTKAYKRHEWELNEYVTAEDIKSKRYAAKRVVIMQAKDKGMKTFDRFGDIRY